VYNPNMPDDSFVIDEETIFTKVDGGEADKTIIGTSDEGTVVVSMVKLHKITGKHVDEVHVTNQITWPNFNDFKEFYQTAGEAIEKHEKREP
jgi:hypothetical protein